MHQSLGKSNLQRALQSKRRWILEQDYRLQSHTNTKVTPNSYKNTLTVTYWNR